jgi:hypothetical protein
MGQWRRKPSEPITDACPECPQKPTLPPPTLRDRRHRGLARRLVAVRRPAVFMLSEGQRPHPRRTDRRRGQLHEAADNNAIGEHVVISSFHSPEEREADARLRIRVKGCWLVCDPYARLCCENYLLTLRTSEIGWNVR